MVGYFAQSREIRARCPEQIRTTWLDSADAVRADALRDTPQTWYPAPAGAVRVSFTRADITGRAADLHT
jgi:hypothetical protein